MPVTYNRWRTLAVYEYVRATLARQQRPPTFEEIAAHESCAVATAHYHVRLLIEAGALRTRGGARGLELTGHDPVLAD